MHNLQQEQGILGSIMSEPYGHVIGGQRIFLQDCSSQRKSPVMESAFSPLTWSRKTSRIKYLPMLYGNGTRAKGVY